MIPDYGAEVSPQSEEVAESLGWEEVRRLNQLDREGIRNAGLVCYGFIEATHCWHCDKEIFAHAHVKFARCIECAEKDLNECC